MNGHMEITKEGWHMSLSCMEQYSEEPAQAMFHYNYKEWDFPSIR